MSHIIPYIPTEPPSIHEDSFEQLSSSSEISDYNFPKVPDVIEKAVTVDDYPITIDQSNGVSNICDTNSRSPLALRRHIDSVIEQNDLRLDATDSGIKIYNDDDAISECSFEGQFDAYIEHVNNTTTHNNDDIMECIDIIDPSTITNIQPHFTNQLDQYQTSGIVINNNIDDDNLEFDEFGDFNLATEAAVDYFIDKSENIHQDNQCEMFAFGDFDATDSTCAVDCQDVDDDFDDFAAFNNEPANFISNEPTYQMPNTIMNSESNINSIVKSFRQKLMAAVGSVDIGMETSADQGDLSRVQSDNFISNNPLINEYGSQIWKELTNFDYSPAFIFHWMQSISYENFMNSMGPDYRELLSTQRATLPLYSVNLTPIEPVPADCFVQTIHSTTSSSLDLTIPEKSGTNLSEKNSSIDIKNLEDEFIFNTNLKDDSSISGMKSDNRSSLPNLSSAVIQSEGLGGIFKSILKPLNSGKTSVANNKPMHPQTESVLKDLPELSYMSSKVLMFPVLASCDIEDNI